jgi:FtsH-binding integral membrane protein
MSDQDYRVATQPTSATAAGAYDAGLRAFMLRVYNYMLMGLVLTGAVAWATFSFAPFRTLFFAEATYAPTVLGWIAIFAPLVFVLVLSFGINRLSAAMAQLLFWVYASVMGISLSLLLFIYTGESIVRVFFITAATFGAMSLWGYTTKRDLTGWGSFLLMGLIGLIIASLVNLFLQSNMMQWIISVIGVLIFTGLTAYDTQKIKMSYDSVSSDGELTGKAAVMGALALYLDFVNLFIYLLRILGSRR